MYTLIINGDTDNPKYLSGSTILPRIGEQVLIEGYEYTVKNISHEYGIHDERYLYAVSDHVSVWVEG